MTYSKITKAQFNEMQFNAGVLVRSFDMDSPAITDEDIVCATTGGFSIAIEPSYEDTGSGVYMMPPETAEMLIVTGYSVEAEFTAISVKGNTIKWMLGAADGTSTITPRNEIHDEDFADLWWIGDRVDGGLVCVKLINALSDEGVELQTTPKGFGEISVHLSAHTSFETDDIDTIPVEIYSVESRPLFDVVRHQFLVAYNADDYDNFVIDESTGMLTITEGGTWHYELDVSTGRMEVTSD